MCREICARKKKFKKGVTVRQRDYYLDKQEIEDSGKNKVMLFKSEA